jgi:hypothetical protein
VDLDLEISNSERPSAGNKIEKNEMGETCGSVEQGSDVYRVWWENLRERSTGEIQP